MIFLLLILSAALGATPVLSGARWTNTELKAYKNRDFITLEHGFRVQRRFSESTIIKRQASDLKGCRALHHGSGGFQAATKCIKFLNREKELGVVSEGRKSLIADINSLCRKMLLGAENLEYALQSGVFKKPLPEWEGCREASWKQVYLTTYAKFDADPVAALALVRRAQANLSPDSVWRRKVRDLVSP